MRRVLILTLSQSSKNWAPYISPLPHQYTRTKSTTRTSWTDLERGSVELLRLPCWEIEGRRRDCLLALRPGHVLRGPRYYVREL